MLDVPYCHLVFTLPHEINPLAHVHAHPRWVYRTLMECVASTLGEFAANPQWLGGTGAFTLVLHTWTQDLRMHLHVYAVMACGALADDGSRVAPKRSPTFLFPFNRRIEAAEAARCPHCKTGRWFTVATLPKVDDAVAAVGTSGTPLAARLGCRGPP